MGKMETEGEAGLLNTEEEAINEEDGSSETEEKDLPVHVKKVKKLKKNIDQVDGTADSSEDDDDVEEDDEDDSDSDLDPDGNSYDGGVEMDPPGSGDDNSDEEASELFDTENVVVCQYDLIKRARNKWKLQLKDGVMNLNGRDFVFQKAHGEVDW